MSLNSRLEKIERTRPSDSEPHGRVMLYDPEGQRPAPPAGAKVVFLIPKNGREPTDKEKP